jgi:hypothetical protein
MPMHLIAFIMEPEIIRPILSHLDMPTTPPPLAPAGGPPPWEADLDQSPPGITLHYRFGSSFPVLTNARQRRLPKVEPMKTGEKPTPVGVARPPRPENGD